MKRIYFGFFAALFATAVFVRAADANVTPDFKEVSDLVRAHLPGVTDAELNRAAVEGLLTGLRGRVVLAGDEAKSPGATKVPLISKTAVLDDGVGYLRVSRVTAGLAKELSEAWQQVSASNKLKGLALDLRYADGDDYAAAAALADLFLRGKKNAIQLPLAVLVNGETSAAAEALAAGLRAADAGLILGNRTAGRAAIMREFSLKDGQRLQIASAPVKLSDGSMLTADGVKPDIAVTVKASDEAAYFADANADLAKTNLSASTSLSVTNEPGGTNRPARKRMSEADLVRKHRSGLDEDDADTVSAAPVAESVKPVLRDPALVRAVDLLKGLALVRQSRGE